MIGGPPRRRVSRAEKRRRLEEWWSEIEAEQKPQRRRRRPRQNPSRIDPLTIALIGGAGLVLLQLFKQQPAASASTSSTTKQSGSGPTTASTSPSAKPPGPHYWADPGGWQTEDSMRKQLLAVGWDGVGAVTDVFARTTGARLQYFA